MDANELTTLHWDSYIERTARIRMLSSPQIDEIETASEYYDLLVNNFKIIGELAKENKALLLDEIYPTLSRDIPKIPEDIVEQLREFEGELLDAYNMENLDLALMATLAERLHRDALRKGDKAYIIEQLDAKVMVYYAIMNMLSRSPEAKELCDEYRELAKEAGRQICSYLDPAKFEALDEQTKAIVMADARYIAVMYDRDMGEGAKREELDYIHMAQEISENPFYRAQLPKYDWNYHKMRAYEYAGQLTEFANEKGLTKEEADFSYRSMEALYALWKEHDYLHGKMTEQEILLGLYRSKYFAGLCSKGEYKEKLLELYEKRNEKEYTIGAVYLNILAPTEYERVLGAERFQEKEVVQLEKFYHQIVDYVMRMPNGGSMSFVLEYAFEYMKSFHGISGGDNFEDMCLNYMATIHPPTYVHTLMVAKLSRSFTVYLLEHKPSVFVGVLDHCQDVEQVLMNRRSIIDFAYHGALCHDIGKMPLVDTLFVYGRDLTEQEFDLIRLHPEIGAGMLKDRHQMSAYADVARGHHKWYDNTAGYPEAFCTDQSKYKIFIDIVAMADCLDAATDGVGRSYQSVKSLEEFIAEVTPLCGKRYAPFFAEIFADQEAISELSFLLDQGRKSVYEDTFLRLKDLQQRAREDE